MMSLTTCFKCGSQVSDSAVQCPKCQILKPWDHVHYKIQKDHREAMSQARETGKKKGILIAENLAVDYAKASHCPECKVEFDIDEELKNGSCRNCGFIFCIQCEVPDCRKNACRVSLSENCYLIFTCHKHQFCCDCQVCFMKSISFHDEMRQDIDADYYISQVPLSCCIDKTACESHKEALRLLRNKYNPAYRSCSKKSNVGFWNKLFGQ